MPFFTFPMLRLSCSNCGFSHPGASCLLPSIPRLVPWESPLLHAMEEDKWKQQQEWRKLMERARESGRKFREEMERRQFEQVLLRHREEVEWPQNLSSLLLKR
mgnify:CR=1 FL=1